MNDIMRELDTARASIQQRSEALLEWAKDTGGDTTLWETAYQHLLNDIDHLNRKYEIEIDRMKAIAWEFVARAMESR